jgi:hypothetical protein
MCIEHDALAAAYALTDRPYKFGVVDGEPLVELALATKNGKTVNQNCFLTLHFLCNLQTNKDLEGGMSLLQIFCPRQAVT